MRHLIILSLSLIFITLLTLTSCSSSDDSQTAQPTIDAIRQRGKLLVGTTGDYRPLSFREPETGNHWGFCIDIAHRIADSLHVDIEFVKTSWPTLSADVLTTPPLFDLAIGGITITEARQESMLMSDGYLANGKTILCRAADADRFLSLAESTSPTSASWSTPAASTRSSPSRTFRTPLSPSTLKTRRSPPSSPTAPQIL